MVIIVKSREEWKKKLKEGYLSRFMKEYSDFDFNPGEILNKFTYLFCTPQDWSVELIEDV